MGLKLQQTNNNSSYATRRCLFFCFVLCVCAIIYFAPSRACAAEQQPVESSAYAQNTSFGFNDFERAAKGTSRLVSGQNLGYHFFCDAHKACVVAFPSHVLVLVPQTAAQQTGFSPTNEKDTTALREAICQKDQAFSLGGELLKDRDAVQWIFVVGDTADIGDIFVRSNIEIDNNGYISFTSKSQQDISQDVLWCDTFSLVAQQDVCLQQKPSISMRIQQFFSSLDMRPFWVSLRTSAVALIIVLFLGVFAAWRMQYHSPRIKNVINSLITIPMVLPPTVCGFLLLMLFGNATAIGRWLIAHNIHVVFTWPAAVISAVVVSFPLMYRSISSAFESLDRDMLDAARTLGWSEFKILRKLMLPLCWPALATGCALAFARALGEFGCTLFFAGNFAGVTQTIPIAIYFSWMGGYSTTTIFWVVCVIVFSFIIIFFINVVSTRAQHVQKGTVGAPVHTLFAQKRNTK